ncbi:MAG TPA: hypothetical protein VGO40_15400 [Longimicrobium sp.]|nr:hypothetical protein [Longimicrobium sp.]
MPIKRIHVAALVLSAFWLSPGRAQTLLRCTDADANAKGVCTLHVPKTDTMVRVEIPLHVDGRGTWVHAHMAEGGNGLLTPDSAQASNEIVRFIWRGYLSDTSQALLATAKLGETTAVLPIRIEAKAPVSNVVLAWRGGAQYGYADRQLKYPVTVTIVAPADRCNSTTIAFRAIGDGSVTPDTVHGTQQVGPSSQPECVASTWWRLGKGIGRQNLRASVSGSPSTFATTTGVARALPRIFAGVAVSNDFRNYRTVVHDSTVVQLTVTRGDSTFVTRSVTRRDSVQEQKDDWHFAPTIGGDFPIGRRLEWLRGSLAVSLTSPTRDFYVGASIVQPFAGLTFEGFGIDVHLVGHLGRRVVAESKTCNGQDCETREKLLFLGVGLMAALDQGTLLSTISTLFK